MCVWSIRQDENPVISRFTADITGVFSTRNPYILLCGEQRFRACGGVCACAFASVCVQRDRRVTGERRGGALSSIDLPGRGDAERLEDPEVLLGCLLRLPRLLRLGVIGRHPPLPSSNVRRTKRAAVDSACGEKREKRGATPHESDIPRIRSRTARRATATPTTRRLRAERRR